MHGWEALKIILRTGRGLMGVRGLDMKTGLMVSPVVIKTKTSWCLISMGMEPGAMMQMVLPMLKDLFASTTRSPVHWTGALQNITISVTNWSISKPMRARPPTLAKMLLQTHQPTLHLYLTKWQMASWQDWQIENLLGSGPQRTLMETGPFLSCSAWGRTGKTGAWAWKLPVSPPPF